MKVLFKRIKIPEYLKQNYDNLETFIQEYSDSETGKVNYRDMIDYLKTFNYSTNDKQVVSTEVSSSS